MSGEKPAAKADVTALIRLAIESKVEGHSEAIFLPTNPQAWVKSLEHAIKDTEKIWMHFDTLALGCGGCLITIGSSEDGARDDTNPNTLSFVLSEESMKALKKIVDFCNDTMS